MADESSFMVWREAQQLLQQRGMWTTEGGAYLESEQVTILVHPVLGDDPPVQNLTGDTVDLVVTVRPRVLCELPKSAGVRLIGPAGDTLFRRLNPRGQAVFRKLPAGSWRALLEDAERRGRRRLGGEFRGRVTQWHAIPRLQAAAAADRPRPIRRTYTSSDRQLTTEVVESPDARLVVSISATAARKGAVLVRLTWARLSPEMPEEVRALITPLAPSAGDKALVATYDLGPLDYALALKISPAEWAELNELTPELVREAFSYALYGSARRAWESLAVHGSCPHAAREAIVAMLDT